MYKKKIIIWTIITIVATILVLLVNLYFNSQKLESNKKDDYLGIDCNTFGHLDIEREGDVLWNKQDLCLIAQAKAELNVEKCPKYAGFCVNFVANKRKDYSICDYIEGYKGDCIIEVAKAKIDINKCFSYFTEKYKQHACLDAVEGEKIKMEAIIWPVYNNKKYIVKYPSQAEIFVPNIKSSSPDINSTDVMISTKKMSLEILLLNLNDEEKNMNFEKFSEYAVDKKYFNMDYRNIDGELAHEYNESGINISSLSIKNEKYHKIILFEHKNDRYLFFVSFYNESGELENKRENLIILNQVLETFKFNK